MKRWWSITPPLTWLTTTPVLIATDTASDSFLVDDVVTNLRSVKYLTVEARALVEYPTEVRAEIVMAAREDSASRILDHTVGGKAGDERREITVVVRADVLLDRVPHR